jgi:hypothetical protein
MVTTAYTLRIVNHGFGRRVVITDSGWQPTDVCHATTNGFVLRGNVRDQSQALSKDTRD